MDIPKTIEDVDDDFFETVTEEMMIKIGFDDPALFDQIISNDRYNPNDDPSLDFEYHGDPDDLDAAIDENTDRITRLAEGK